MKTDKQTKPLPEVVSNKAQSSMIEKANAQYTAHRELAEKQISRGASLTKHRIDL